MTSDEWGPLLDDEVGAPIRLRLRSTHLEGVLSAVSYRPDGTPLVLYVDQAPALGGTASRPTRVPWNAVEWYDDEVGAWADGREAP